MSSLERIRKVGNTRECVRYQGRSLFISAITQSPLTVLIQAQTSGRVWETRIHFSSEDQEGSNAV